MYTAFDSAGRPVRVFEVPEDHADHALFVQNNTLEGERVFAGDLADTHYVDSAGNLQLVPPPPSPYQEWNWLTKTYDAPDIARAREKMKSRVSAEKDRRRGLGCRAQVHPGTGTPLNVWLHTDEASLVQYLNVKVMAEQQLKQPGNNANSLFKDGAGQPIVWKFLGGQESTLTLSSAQVLCLRAQDYLTKVHQAQQYHLHSLDNAIDPLNYNYSTVWPEHYQGQP